ncbi:Rieske (2Fe-2S) protein [bacterium]|nr:MAG: Rieske (2Fe-2S) protein [bacterium]
MPDPKPGPDRVFEVGTVDEFTHGVVRLVQVKGREVGVLRWYDRWYALRNVCPHIGGPVCNGLVSPLLVEERPWSDADLRVDTERPMLMCPWHFWEYDLTTGLSLSGRESVRMYGAYESAGRVFVDLSLPPRAIGSAGVVAGNGGARD